jgi:MFS family permease
MLLGLAGMLVTSLLAAFATTLPLLVVGSVGLALCSAVVVPLSLAAVLGTFGQRVLPVAIALYLALQLMASLLAPPMAQALFDAAGWAATYAPAILATTVAIVAGRRWLARTGPGDRMSRVDAASLLLWSVGMLALVYAIVAFAGGWGEAPEIAAALGILCLLWAASRLARDTTHLLLPHVPFRIVGVTLFTGGVLGLAQSGSLLQFAEIALLAEQAAVDAAVNETPHNSTERHDDHAVERRRCIQRAHLIGGMQQDQDRPTHPQQHVHQKPPFGFAPALGETKPFAQRIGE